MLRIHCSVQPVLMRYVYYSRVRIAMSYRLRGSPPSRPRARINFDEYSLVRGLKKELWKVSL